MARYRANVTLCVLQVRPLTYVMNVWRYTYTPSKRHCGVERENFYVFTSFDEVVCNSWLHENFKRRYVKIV